MPWAWLAIGNTGASSDGLPDLRFTAVDGAFRQAVLSNRLFMVLGDAKSVLDNGSVAYQLTRASLGLIKALPPPPKGVPPAVYDAVAKAVEKDGYRVYPTETAFNDMLKDATKAIGGITPEEMLVFQRFAGLLSPAIGDWLFRMSPRNWAAPDRVGPKNARLIFKFVGGRTLADLVADTAAWRWPEASSEDGKASTARDDIQSIIRTAREASAAAKAKNQTSPYEPFLKVVDNPNWSGVLALSVEVPLDSLPEPLQPLAAGIDPKSFYAHHLGLTATSFTSDSGAIKFDVTSSFGLIDYQNPVDQYFSSDIPFAFRVQQLTVGFENGKLSSFSSSAQLMINRLFGADTRLFPSEHGNNIILDGVYQTERNDGGGQRDTYVFAMRETGAYQLALSALTEVGVEQTRLATVRAADPASGNTTVTGAFQMTGRLRFVEPDNFDPFCWGPPTPPPDTTGAFLSADAPAADATGSKGLLFSNYTITMSFALSDPANVKFTVADGAIAFDTANSPARQDSLFARFPLRLTGLLATPDTKVMGGEASTRDPEAAGFVSVSAPLQQGKLTQPWYGLVYEVDLGTLGALAGSVGLTVRLLAAWSPANNPEGRTAVYFGVALPGVEKMLGVTLPLQGILDIGFRTIQFTTYDDKDGRRQYLMRLRDFGLHVLGLSFPPGHNDITVFGNPDQTSNTKLGWYAAYENGKSDKKSARRAVTAADSRGRMIRNGAAGARSRSATGDRVMPQRVILDGLWCGQGMANMVRVFKSEFTDPKTNPSDWLCVFDFGSGGLSESKKELGITPPVRFMMEQLKLQQKAGRTPQIDLLLISHQDRDHWQLLRELNEQIELEKMTVIVGRMILGGANWRQSSTDAVMKFYNRVPDPKNNVNWYDSEYSAYYDPKQPVRTLSIGDLKLSLLVTNVAANDTSDDIERNCSSAVVLLTLPSLFGHSYGFILPGDCDLGNVCAAEDNHGAVADQAAALHLCRFGAASWRIADHEPQYVGGGAGPAGSDLVHRLHPPFLDLRKRRDS